MKELNVNIKVHTLKRYDRQEGWKNAKPYLWNIFFKADGVGIKIMDNFRLEGNAIFRFSKGSHDNLGLYPLANSDTVKIPSDVGAWETLLFPLDIPHFEETVPGIIGMVSILMLENNVSAKGAEAGHQALNAFIQKAASQVVADFHPKIISLKDIQGSIENYFNSSLLQYEEELEAVVVNAIRNSQNILSNLWSLVKKDDLVGFEVWKFDHESIHSNKGQIPFSKRWTTELLGDWEIFGELTANK